MNNNFDVRVQWHQPDQHFAAVLMRDGQEWYLNGALVGMGSTRGEAVEDLVGIAAYLVVHGINFLMAVKLPVADRLWLFELLDGRPMPPVGDDEEEINTHTMYLAMIREGMAR